MEAEVLSAMSLDSLEVLDDEVGGGLQLTLCVVQPAQLSAVPANIRIRCLQFHKTLELTLYFHEVLYENIVSWYVHALEVFKQNFKESLHTKNVIFYVHFTSVNVRESIFIFILLLAKTGVNFHTTFSAPFRF